MASESSPEPANGTGTRADGRPTARLPTALLPREGRITNRGQQASYVWSEMPAPVIAAIHGHALGGGLQLALGADIRIVSPDATLSVLEVRWGLVPDMTGTQILPGLVGLDMAKELTFTGRMVSGDEAVRIGLATRVSDAPFEEARRLARQIAGNSPAAVQGAKRLLNLAGHVSLEDGLHRRGTHHLRPHRQPEPGGGRPRLLREASAALHRLTVPALAAVGTPPQNRSQDPPPHPSRHLQAPSAPAGQHAAVGPNGRG